ncbi:MAG: ribonuclease III [Parcubacteria group bacterium]|nr:ribonuclease III [Parcubacteria group bacterium]
MKDLAAFEERLGVAFENKELLLQSLTHRSYLNENPHFHLDHNERLEFLGDAVLELIVTEYLYRTYPNPEGELTSYRAALVNSTMLASVAASINISDVIQLSRGEAKDSGRARQYILANALEALLGALYLDKGYEAVRTFVGKEILPHLPDIIAKKRHRDPKSHFQEIAQERYGITPNYTVLQEEGPDHDKRFRVGVFLKDELRGEGEGPSKQIAEVAAADAALRKEIL